MRTTGGLVAGLQYVASVSIGALTDDGDPACSGERLINPLPSDIVRQLRFRAVDQLSRALVAYAAGKGDFADYLIREHARAADCESEATFDTVLGTERKFGAVHESLS